MTDFSRCGNVENRLPKFVESLATKSHATIHFKNKIFIADRSESEELITSQRLKLRKNEARADLIPILDYWVLEFLDSRPGY